MMEKSQKAKVVHQNELLEMLGETKHEIQFAYCCPVPISNLERITNSELLSRKEVLQLLFAELSKELSEETIQHCGEHLQVESLSVSVCLRDNCPYKATEGFVEKSAAIYFCCTWSVTDEKLAWKVISVMKNLNLSYTERYLNGLTSSHARTHSADYNC